jgi:cleavage stimulation factor subunit 3
METELDNFSKVEQIFGRSITQTPYIELWSSYINYIRRINNLTTDQSGQARTIITQVYEFVLDKMGIDTSSGKIWLDYIELLKSGPGVLGGNNWQDMQKMDTLRKVYQRAISVPTNATLEIWRDYDRFEMGLNKVTVGSTTIFLPLEVARIMICYRAVNIYKRSQHPT